MAGDVFDNNSKAIAAPPPRPDAHGHAALLLVESLIHALIALRLITVADAVEVVDVAAEVSDDMGEAPGSGRETLQSSIDLLQSIRASLAFDLPGKELPGR